MGKNKLAKFDDMAVYPHVFQFPFATLQEKGFDLKGHWNESFLKTTTRSFSNWDVEKVNIPLVWENYFRTKTS